MHDPDDNVANGAIALIVITVAIYVILFAHVNTGLTFLWIIICIAVGANWLRTYLATKKKR